MMGLDKRILKYLLENLSDKDLNILVKQVKIKITGFSIVGNKKMSIPKNLLIKNILDTTKTQELKEYFLKDSLSIRDYTVINEQEMINLFIGEKEQKYIMEFLLASLEYDFIEIKNIVNGYIKEEKELNFYENKVVEKKNIKEIKKVKLSNDLNGENIRLNKEVNILKQENSKLKKDIEINKKKLERYQGDYDNLKKKYDDVKIKELELIMENTSIKKDKGKLEKMYDQLELENLQLTDKLEKKIGIIGEFNNNYFDDEFYDISNINISNLENLNNIAKEYKEIWILLYELPIYERRKINNIKKDNIYKFKNFTELNSYINKGA